jgi:adenylate cyclase
VIDSRFSDAWTALSDCIARRIIAGWFDDWDEGTKQACYAASQAIASDPENGRALSLAAWNAAMLARRNDEAYELANHALRLHPNSTYVRNNCAWVYIYHGEPDLALHHLQVARRMNPVDPREYLTFNAMALAHLTAKRFSEVLRWSERAIQQRPGFPPPYRFRASALAHLGRFEEAFATIQHMLTLQPNSTIRRASRTGYKNPADLAILVDGLRLAGLPE